MQQILLEKYKTDQLGHFYILTPNRNTSEKDFLSNWTFHLLSKLLNIKEVRNHEDFLEVKPTKDNGTYGLDDLSNLFNFLNYKASKANRKIILIHSANKFSHFISNKLLKTLEEPPVRSTIFLLNPTGATLLQTISSRGIKLRIPVEIAEDLSFEIEMLKELHELPIHSIIDRLKNNIKEHRRILSALSNWSSANQTNFSIFIQLQAIIKEYEQDQLYHNAPTHRLYALANLIKELTL